ncbi:MAG: L,D-transpeptidase family protein [Jatrophihabitans sp.]
MSVGRVLSSVASCTAVAGCAVLVIGMARAGGEPNAKTSKSVTPSPGHSSRSAIVAQQPTSPSIPSLPPDFGAAGSPATRAPASVSATLPPNASAQQPAAVVPPAVPAHIAVAPPAPPAATHRTAAARPVARPAGAVGSALPLHYSTGSATRVITVTASSHGSTTAKLQAWTKRSGGLWLPYGSPVTAHVGSDGIGTASESRSTTPAGSFTLTQAFGYYTNPGTSLPYFRTTPSDYWISDAGSRYNTHQRCSGCGYDDGTNERLYTETPYYNYAVVIDYNTRNAPGGVQRDKGSAFFLHVEHGGATAGCVSIPQSKLTTLMRWLTPSAHPRILIGVT